MIPDGTLRITQRTKNRIGKIGNEGKVSFVSPTVFIVATWIAAICGGIGIAAAFVSAIVGYQLTETSLQEANVKIADANRRVAEATATTEQLKHENLEMERSLRPRRIEYIGFIKVLKKYAGTKVVFATIPDFEPWRVATELMKVFAMSGWAVNPDLRTNPYIGDGIWIDVFSGVVPPPPPTAPPDESKPRPPPPPIKIVGDHENEIAYAILAHFKEVNIDAKVSLFPPAAKRERRAICAHSRIRTTR